MATPGPSAQRGKMWSWLIMVAVGFKSCLPSRTVPMCHPIHVIFTFFATPEPQYRPQCQMDILCLICAIPVLSLRYLLFTFPKYHAQSFCLTPKGKNLHTEDKISRFPPSGGCSLDGQSHRRTEIKETGDDYQVWPVLSSRRHHKPLP